MSNSESVKIQIIFHRVRNNYFRVSLKGMDDKGNVRKLKFEKKVPFEVFKLVVGDKLELEVGDNG